MSSLLSCLSGRLPHNAQQWSGSAAPLLHSIAGMAGVVTMVSVVAREDVCKCVLDVLKPGSHEQSCGGMTRFSSCGGRKEKCVLDTNECVWEEKSSDK